VKGGIGKLFAKVIPLEELLKRFFTKIGIAEHNRLQIGREPRRHGWHEGTRRGIVELGNVKM
jgi:hypothetical protein